jgi:hypothetical protein
MPSAWRVQIAVIELHVIGDRDGEEMKKQAETVALQLMIVYHLIEPHE